MCLTVSPDLRNTGGRGPGLCGLEGGTSLCGWLPRGRGTCRWPQGRSLGTEAERKGRVPSAAKEAGVARPSPFGGLAAVFFCMGGSWEWIVSWIVAEVFEQEFLVVFMKDWI